MASLGVCRTLCIIGLLTNRRWDSWCISYALCGTMVHRNSVRKALRIIFRSGSKMVTLGMSLFHLLLSLILTLTMIVVLTHCGTHLDRVLVNWWVCDVSVRLKQKTLCVPLAVHRSRVRDEGLALVCSFLIYLPRIRGILNQWSIFLEL